MSTSAKQGLRPDEGHDRPPPPARRVAIRTIARTRSSSVDSVDGVDAGPPEGRADRRPRASSAAASKRRRKARIAGVDVELLAGLGVLEDDRADVGQRDLARVDQPDRR